MGVQRGVNAAPVSGRMRLVRFIRLFPLSALRPPSRHSPPPPMQPESLQLLVTRTMPYGKYKGRLIADLPGNYLNWFAREGFPPGEIGRLLALMHELDHNGLSALLDPLRQR